KNRSELPPQLLPTKNRPLHRNGRICGLEHQKPEILMDYNATKGGVDNMDKLVSAYSFKRRTLRWPLAIFFNILDISAYALYTLLSFLLSFFHSSFLLPYFPSFTLLSFLSFFHSSFFSSFLLPLFFLSSTLLSFLPSFFLFFDSSFLSSFLSLLFFPFLFSSFTLLSFLISFFHSSFFSSSFLNFCISCTGISFRKCIF